MLKEVQYKDVFRYCWHYWRRQPYTGAAIIALMIASVIMDAFIPVYTGKIIDVLSGAEGAPENRLETALVYLAVFGGLALAFHTLRFFSFTLWVRFAVNKLYDIVTEATHKVMRFSADWHANSFAGGTVRKITRGMWAFDVLEDTILIGILPALLIMIGMTAILVVHIPVVGIFAGVMAVIFTAFSVWTSVKIAAPGYKESADCDTKVGATLADIMTGIPTVKAFGSEGREDALFQSVADLWRTKSARAWQIGEWLNLARNLIRIVMMVGMIGLTIWLWQNGRATPGDIALALTSFFVISGYMRDIGMHIANLQKSISEMEDVVAFWLREDEILDAPDAQPFRPENGEIVFDNVSFIYKGQQKPLFEDLSLRIAPGEKIALVGHSGSGKSTFVKLLQRLYDVSGGEIRIDGQNIAHVRQDTLRHAIALVPQEPILFHRSLADNIAYGCPDANMEEIIEAAKKAYAHEFIAELPDNYATLVGERGVKLSGGERQRVAIARAVLTDAPILVLDEATSALDSISEYYIQQALAYLMKGRTTITVAHRLSTIRTADRILVFDKGRIVEEGTHRELITRADSHYRELYEVQSGQMVAEYTELTGAA